MDFTRDTFEKVLENLHDGLYFVDRDRKITYWNAAAERITGYAAREVIGKSCSDNILNHVDGDGNKLCLGLCPLAETIADGQPRESSIYLHHKQGHRVPVSVRVIPLTDRSGRIVGGIELFTDISNQVANALRIEELEKLALLDRLTQLSNRHHIETELHSRFEERARFGLSFGLLLMDIDQFKTINDTYGHATGDLVLQYVAKTLLANSRAFDLYGRWGGDEFVGIIRNVDADELAWLGNRLRTLVENAYLLHEESKLQVTLSIGATLVKEKDNVDSLFKRADALLYQSKGQGRNRLTPG